MVQHWMLAWQLCGFSWDPEQETLYICDFSGGGGGGGPEPLSPLCICTCHLPIIGSAVAQWLSAWLETEGPRVRASPASLRCGPWVRHIYPSLVLVQPRKTRPCLTERLLMGRKESNQTKLTDNENAQCNTDTDENQGSCSLWKELVNSWNI